MGKQTHTQTEAVSLKTSYLLLIGLGILVFFNTLFNNFVWLDNIYIANNPVIVHFDLLQIIQNNHTTSGGYFRPLTTIYYAIVYNIGINQPFLFHILQIAFRITEACLLFGIFHSFFRRKLALFLAIIYLVHPLNHSVTAFISNSADSLFMSFGIGALFLLIKHKLIGYNRLVIMGLLLCSILAKESGVLFFGVIFLYIFLFRKKELFFYSIGEAVALGLYLLIRYTSHGFTQIDASLIPIMQLPLLERLLSVPQIIFYYLKNFFVPLFFGINSLWYVKSFSLQYFFIPLFSILLFFIALLSLGVYSKNKTPTLFKNYIFFLFFFCFGLSAYLQIIPLDYTVASRWFIFPMIGLLGLVGIFLEAAYKYTKHLTILAIIIIALLSMRSIYLNTIWNNNISLFTYAASKNSNYFNYFALASTLYANGKYKEALPPVKLSESDFAYDIAYALEGNIHKKLGDTKDEEKAYEKSLALHADTPHPYELLTYINLSKYLLKEKSYADAEKLLFEALPRNAKVDTLWILIAYTEYQLKQYDKAGAALKQAYEINPRNLAIHDIYIHLVKKEPVPASLEQTILNYLSY